MSLPYIIQNDNIVIYVNNQPYNIHKSNINYDDVLAAIETGRWDDVIDVISPKTVFVNYSENRISIKGNQIFWKDSKGEDVQLHGALVDRFVRLYKEKKPIRSFVLFIEKLMENPSATSVRELYAFLENNGLPITENGNFIAYKRVTKDYLDIYSKKIDNSVGQVVTFDRNQVDDDSARECSFGLHVCSMEYLKTHGYGAHDDPIMVCEINPKDVVAVPKSYGYSKMRTCEYTVLSELGSKEDAEEIEKSVMWTPTE